MFVSLQPTLDSLYGHEGSDLSGKRTFTNVIFDVRISQIQDQKRTQPKRPCWVYCTLFSRQERADTTIYHDVGYLELLILVKACESPHVG